MQKAERIDVSWSSYFGLDPPSMGELLGMPKAGRLVCQLVEKFPRLQIEATPRPVTRSLLRLELTIRPDFVWDQNLHGASEAFWILVEDCDGEQILYHDTFILRKDYADGDMNEHLIELTVPIDEPAAELLHYRPFRSMDGIRDEARGLLPEAHSTGKISCSHACSRPSTPTSLSFEEERVYGPI